MIVQKFSGGSEQPEDVRRSKDTPASNTAAVVTLAAVDAFTRHLIHRVAWSYNGDPTGGRLTISDGGTTFFDVDITKSGPGSLHFSTPCGFNSAVVVTLAAGGGGITGKLYVESTTTRN
jgi:hypothetical protein